MSGVRRVIVGASGSPGSLRALRYAEDLARAHDATVIPVLAWAPPGGDVADRRSPCGYLRRIWEEDACRGSGMRSSQPGEKSLTVRWSSLSCSGARLAGSLVSMACCPGDLLVVGAGRRGALARMVSGKGEPLLPGPCPVPGARRSATGIRPGSQAWPARVGVLAPDAGARSGPSGPRQGSRLTVTARKCARVAALVRPLGVGGILAPAIATAALPVA